MALASWPSPSSPTAPTTNLVPTWKSEDPLKMVTGSHHLAHDPPKSPSTTWRKSRRARSGLQVLRDLLPPTVQTLLSGPSHWPLPSPQLSAWLTPHFSQTPAPMSPLQEVLPCHPDPPYPIALISLLQSTRCLLHVVVCLFIPVSLCWALGEGRAEV